MKTELLFLWFASVNFSSGQGTSKGLAENDFGLREALTNLYKREIKCLKYLKWGTVKLKKTSSILVTENIRINFEPFENTCRMYIVKY